MNCIKCFMRIPEKSWYGFVTCANCGTRNQVTGGSALWPFNGVPTQVLGTGQLNHQRLWDEALQETLGTVFYTSKEEIESDQHQR